MTHYNPLLIKSINTNFIKLTVNKKLGQINVKNKLKVSILSCL